jgi:hypothetical protein
VAQKFASAGGAPKYLNAAALTNYQNAESQKWGEAIRFSGAKLD